MALQSSYDLGDKVYLTWNTVDSSGNAVNPGTVTLNITLPDASTSTVTNSTSTTGTYTASFLPTQVGRHIIAWSATGSWPQATSDVFEVRDIADIGIVSFDEAKAYLNIPATDTTQDIELRNFLDAATDLAEGYVGQVLGRRTFTNELYDGGTEFIRIRNPKAISITSVTENGATVPSSNYVLDYTGQRLYRIGSGTLYATNSYGYWTAGMNNVSITYVAGYVNPPPSARQGVLVIFKHLWESQRGAMNVMGRVLGGDELYQTPTYSLPRRAMELLDPTSFPGLA
jgi:hypothetical protein